jgi:hypothetical protein
MMRVRAADSAAHRRAGSVRAARLERVPMPRIEPFSPRYTTTEGHDGLTVIIPARRNWLLILVVSFWLTMWVSMGVTVALVALSIASAISTVVAPSAYPFIVFGVLWSLVWLVATFWVLRSVAWSVGGREVVLVNEQALTTQRRIGPWPAGRRYEYAAEHIGDLRVDAGMGGSRGSIAYPRRRWGTASGAGGVAFDYGARTRRFGESLDEAEAKQIVALFQERLGRPR